MISSLSIRSHYTTELTRCINKVIILLPLGKPCKINLNGSIMTIENGVIINNADLYQMIDVQDLLELDIPLPLFIEKDACLSHSFFDFNQIRYVEQFKNLILQKLQNNAQDKNVMNYYISNIIEFLLKEAKVTLQYNYLPPLYTKHPLVYRLTQYIHKNIYDTLTTKQVSKTFFISQSYISILFSKILTMNFKQYISSLKIALSVFDLIQDSKAIHDVATKYKFMNVSTYSKHFKHYIGVPPKRYIYQFRKGYFNDPYQIAINEPNLSKYFSDIHYYSRNQTEIPYTLNLADLSFNQRFHDTFMVIRIDNLQDLLKFNYNAIQNNIYSNFSKVNFLIKNTDFVYLNDLDTQQLFETIKYLITQGYDLTFKITTLNLVQTFDYHVLKVLKETLNTKNCLEQITLLFELEISSIKDMQCLIKRLNHQFPLLKIGIVIDSFIEYGHNLTHIIKKINALQVDYFYINHDLITFGNLISKKSTYSKSENTLKQNIALFLHKMGIKHSKKLIFAKITHNALKAYFNNETDATHILLSELLIELNQYIAGFGYAYYTDDKEHFMLINHHQSVMPIVHVYSLLKPFLNNQVALLSYGIIAKTKNHYHFLLFNNQSNQTHKYVEVNINHNFSNDFPVFTRLLNRDHGMVSQLVPHKLNQKYINPAILKQINNTNYPLAKLNMHAHKEPMVLTVSNSSLLYFMIPIK